MSRGGYRDNRWENSVINKIDRGRYSGPKANPYDEGEKKRLHECQQGQWVKQVLAGKDHYGPMLRVIDAKGGILENRHGARSKLPPRTQVMVQP